MSVEIKDLHENGWDESNDTYSEWGLLVYGYYYTGKSLRREYLKFLLKQDPRCIYVRSHISAIRKAIHMKNFPEKYGVYGDIFTNKLVIG